MTISASSLSHVLHGMAHHQPRPSATRGQPFAQQLQAAQTGSAGASAASPDEPGALLSSDLLQAMQAIK
jgi:hypothetical protein